MPNSESGSSTRGFAGTRKEKQREIAKTGGEASRGGGHSGGSGGSSGGGR
jgi:hypothetical protein